VPHLRRSSPRLQKHYGLAKATARPENDGRRCGFCRSDETTGMTGGRLAPPRHKCRGNAAAA